MCTSRSLLMIAAGLAAVVVHAGSGSLPADAQTADATTAPPSSSWSR